MKRFMMLAAVVLCVAVQAAAQSPAEQAVLKLEQQWTDALVKADLAALDRIYHEDLVYTHSSGVVDTKATYIDSIKTGKTKYESFDRSEVRVRFHGDAALVTCRSVIKVNGNTLTVRYIHVYVKQKGAWKMVAHQATRLTT